MDIKVNLSVSGLQELKHQLEAYKNSLPQKMEKLNEELADIGMAEAELNSGNFCKHIDYRKETVTTGDVCKTSFIASDKSKIISTWVVDKDGTTKSAEVSPILMAEFGSGVKADKYPKKISGVGRGTFPKQKHANNPSGWSWQEEVDGEWKHSTGVEPRMPMYKASLRMRADVETVAKGVFKT